ncbi:MAG: DUF1826 domain-containing protein [Bacteroidota bacterium]
MKTKTTSKNYAVGTEPTILKNIHQTDVNIALYNRDTDSLVSEVNSLMEQDIEIRASGDIGTILHTLTQAIDPVRFPLLLQDMQDLLHLFKEVTLAPTFRLLLATINSNMCRRFHTDGNDLRMLCTYSGPGTLWLTEDNVNRSGLNSRGDNDCIVLDESKIQQAETGSVLILKGAIYPQEGTKAVVHRSPTIEESGGKRLLLRIDTNQFLGWVP